MARAKAASSVAEAGAASASSSSAGPPVPGRQAPKRRASRLPAPARFPLVAVLSSALVALGYSSINHWTGGELATIARTLNRAEGAVVFGWSVFQLALAWFLGFDGFDVAALSLLSHGPTLNLLTSFYGIRTATAAAYLAVDVLAVLVPFVLLRPLSGAHSAAATVPNRELLVDRPITVYTTVLAGTIYCVSLSTAYRLYLPRVLVLYFEGIPSIETARSATTFLFVSAETVVLSLLFGLAARTLIFAPFAGTGRAPDDARVDAFDPAAATLKETLWWNLWGYTAQGKVLVTRTAVAALVPAVGTFLECALTINGVEAYGAAAYAAVWAAAALLTGLGLGVVGRA